MKSSLIKASRIVPIEEKHAEILADLSSMDATTQWTKIQFLESINNECFGWLCQLDSQTIGYIFLSNPQASTVDILSTCVIPAYRQRGIGSILLSYMLSTLTWCKFLQVQSVFLEVSEANAIALKMYAQHGFKEAGRRNNYYKTSAHTYSAAIIMEKEIAQNKTTLV